MDTKLKQEIESFIVDYINEVNPDHKLWFDGAFELLIQTLENK